MGDTSNDLQVTSPAADIPHYEQWQRPPSRGKDPSQAQYLDDEDNPYLKPRVGTAKQQQAAGKRPKIDFFNNRSAGPSHDFNNNGMRPPSRHKDPPLAQGLDLPPDSHDDIHNQIVDIDSDSSSDFEAGIDRANQKSMAKEEESFGKCKCFKSHRKNVIE